MIGFYLKITCDNNTKLKLIKITFKQFSNLPSFKNNCLYIFNDENYLAYKQIKEYTFYNVGTLIYEDRCNNKALEKISNELYNGKRLKDIICKTRGQFCLLIFDGKKVFIITDKLGIFPIYIYQKNNSIQVTNIFSFLAKQNSVSLNFQALAEFMSLREDGYCIGSTFFNEIKRLDMGRIYQFGDEVSSDIYFNLFDNIIPNKFKNFIEICDKSKEILKENLYFLKSVNNTFVDITGGFDSRIITTILNSIGIKYTGGICGEQEVNESLLAERVAKELEIQFKNNFRIKDINDFINTINLHFTIGSGVPLLYHATELIYYYKKIKENYHIHIGGFGGTEIITQYYKPLRIFSSQLKVQTFAEKHYKFLNIFKEEYITQKDYYNNLNNKIHRSCEKIGSNKFKDIATSLIFSIYSRYYHGSIIGTHNCILPFYSPYFESNFLRFMLETSYNSKKDHQIQKKILMELNPKVSSIMTTHGYSAYIEPVRVKDILYLSKDVFKNFGRRVAYENKFTIKVKDLLSRFFIKKKSPFVLIDSGRLFWDQFVQKKFSERMEIFEIIDRKKFMNILCEHPYKNKYLARIVYLNELFKQFNPN